MERKRNRLEGYDYAYNGYYFTTICVDDRKCLLGTIKDEKLVLTEDGEKIKSILLGSPAHYNYLYIDEYAILPNHIHVIYKIESALERITWGNETKVDARCASPTKTTKTSLDFVGTGHTPCPREVRGTRGCASPTNISKIIQAFKSIARKTTGIKWQRSFWDHIIRTEESHLKIKEYIINNPLKWELDAENPESGNKNINKYYQDVTGYIPPERDVL
jgi:putative transposase